jgi:hypothetical protein
MILKNTEKYTVITPLIDAERCGGCGWSRQQCGLEEEKRKRSSQACNHNGPVHSLRLSSVNPLGAVKGSSLCNAHAKVECQTPNSLSTPAPCLKPPPRHVSNSIAPPDHQSRAPAWNEARSRRSHVFFSFHSVSFLFLCFKYTLYIYFLSFHSIALYLSSCLLFHLLCIGCPCLLTVTLCCASTRRVIL